MLRKFIDDISGSTIKGGDIVEYAAGYFERALEENNSKPLVELFGKSPGQYYLAGAKLEKVKSKIHSDIENGDGAENEDLLKMFFTELIDVAYYYACQQGSLELAKYFVEQLHLPGDLQRDVYQCAEHFAPKTDFKGPPLKLAVQSGNLNLVQYLYENTDALIETCVGDPTEKTLVMLAAEAGNVLVLKYLLDHGGNADASVFGDRHTALNLAIKGKNAFIVRLLVNAGAVVTNHAVHYAISNHLDIETILFLLKQSINHEEAGSPYLFAAVRNGNLELVQYILSHPEFRSIEQCAEFCELPVTDSLLIAAVGSGNLGLVNYLLTRPEFQRDGQVICIQHRKSMKLLLNHAASSGSLEMLKFVLNKLPMPLASIVQGEFAAVEEYYQQHYNDKYFETSSERFEVIRKSFLYSLVSGDDESKLACLRYVIEELKIIPPQIYLKELCAGASISLWVTAYLHSLITENAAEADQLRKIADSLHVMTLPELFKIFNTRLVQGGNYYKRYKRNEFDEFMKEIIKDKIAEQQMVSVVRALAKDRGALTGALFYYCDDQADRSVDKFMTLVSLLPKPDQQNCMGDTLASWAVKQRCFKIMEKMLNRGADPDLPNHEGETLMNRLLQYGFDVSRFSLVKEYINTYTNTLMFASKRNSGGSEEMEEILKFSHGGTGGIPVNELLRNSCKGNMIDKILVLFKYLPRQDAIQVVRLLHDATFTSGLDQYSLARLFEYLEQVSEKELSAQEKQARLHPASDVSAGGIFGIKNAIPSQDEDIRSALRQSNI